MYWITFNYGPDLLAAKIDGLKAERWWNKTKLPDVTLKKEYTYDWVRSLHPNDIQAGLFFVAGLEMREIRNLRITDEYEKIEDVWNALS